MKCGRPVVRLEFDGRWKTDRAREETIHPSTLHSVTRGLTEYPRKPHSLISLRQENTLIPQTDESTTSKGRAVLTHSDLPNMTTVDSKQKKSPTSFHQARVSLNGDGRSSQQALPGETIVTGVKGREASGGTPLFLLGPVRCVLKVVADANGGEQTSAGLLMQGSSAAVFSWSSHTDDCCQPTERVPDGPEARSLEPYFTLVSKCGNPLSRGVNSAVNSFFYHGSTQLELRLPSVHRRFPPPESSGCRTQLGSGYPGVSSRSTLQPTSEDGSINVQVKGDNHITQHSQASHLPCQAIQASLLPSRASLLPS
uniref:Uncharacterized protein n=1 Tax=Timema douglasi TaxID=61478 RepID=A0A7R8VS80_TIMDO|nr:unnamed protein product [Timema douglasi]